MKSITSLLLSTILIITACLFSTASYSQFGDGLSPREEAEKKCNDYNLPKPLCLALVASFFDAANEAVANSGTLSFEEYFAEQLESNVFKSDKVLNEVIFNSGIIGARLADSPLSLKFKALDVENADTVIGLEFLYSRELNRQYLTASETMRRYYAFEFDVSGVITQNADENPRNFIEANISVLGGAYTRIPTQPQMVTDTAQFFVDNIDDEAARNAFFNAMDDITKPLGGFTYLKYGLAAGYEADQRFDAKNAVVSAFAFAQYESWDDASFLGRLGILPSLRVALDEVNPSAQTPRALMGDESSYSRLSGEISLWMPILQFSGEPMYITFNYQTYRELSASDAVVNAGLEKQHLRTYTIGSPSGIYFSYASGSLPFDLQSQQTVELGFKTYF